MKSPFPGMDPYLERYWGDVQTRLTAYAADQINTRLPDDLVARTEEYVAVSTPDEDKIRQIAPDVSVIEYEGPPGPSAAAGGLAVAEPLLLRLSAQPRTLRRVLIYDLNSGNRVVTAIEFLSPSNKVGQEGRAAYRRKRAEFLSAGVSFVEIDLIRDGGYLLYPDEELMVGRLRVPYRACVVRGWDRLTTEAYPFPIRERLPAIRIPLRRTDPDVALDLQALIDQVYQNGRYGRTIDYRPDPDPNLPPDDAAWVDALLKNAGRR